MGNNRYDILYTFSTSHQVRDWRCTSVRWYKSFRQACPRFKTSSSVNAYGVPSALLGYTGSTVEKSSCGNSDAIVLMSVPVSQGFDEFSGSFSVGKVATWSAANTLPHRICLDVDTPLN